VRPQGHVYRLNSCRDRRFGDWLKLSLQIILVLHQPTDRIYQPDFDLLANSERGGKTVLPTPTVSWTIKRPCHNIKCISMPLICTAQEMIFAIIMYPILLLLSL